MHRRIAVTYEDGNIFQHFGHSKEFKLYDIEDSKIVHSGVLPTLGSHHDHEHGEGHTCGDHGCGSHTCGH